MASDDERWQVYVMPAQPISGAVWSGSFADKPQYSVSRGVMIIEGADDEPEVIVSLNVAMSIMFARQDYIDTHQPKPPTELPTQQGDPGAGF